MGILTSAPQGCKDQVPQFALIHIPSCVSEGVILKEKSFQGVLEFKNVRFAYPARPEVPIFQDFSLPIPAGSVTALVGSRDSGKSTVVSLLLKLYDPISGAISLHDHDIRQLNPGWLRSKIGTVSQEPILFSYSITENIAYGADNPSSVTAAQVERVAALANAVTFIQNFPQGFDTVVGEKGVLLSGKNLGMRQRSSCKQGSSCSGEGHASEWMGTLQKESERVTSHAHWGKQGYIFYLFF
nr:ATP-binding cassette sub-family B member 10, mitochondrial [Oryctolagus cuniculus]